MNKASGGKAQDESDPKPAPAAGKCACCGGPPGACGGYAAPDYKCTNAAKACFKCGSKHVDRGSRGWRCRQAKEAAKVLTAGEQQTAFASSWNRFSDGVTVKDTAKVDKVKAAVAAGQ